MAIERANDDCEEFGRLVLFLYPNSLYNKFGILSVQWMVREALKV